MWHMPGKQRHEQDLEAIQPVFLLHADSTLGEIVLPQLHTVVEFVLPSAIAVLSHPDLRQPIGQESIDGIPMKYVGKFETRNGKLATIDWQLRHVEIGREDAALFEVPRGYKKLSPEAAAPLLGMRIAPTPAR